MENKKLKLTELTPQLFRCIIGSCPAVYADEAGDLIIVGAYVDPANTETLDGKVAAGERAIRISRTLVEESLRIELEPVVE